MALKKLSYHEFPNEPRSWELSPVEFGGVNLLVGRNSTGKSRVLNVIHSLTRILANSQGTGFTSGRFQAEIELEGSNYWYAITFSHKQVEEEELKVDGETKLKRDKTGSGEIYFAAEGKKISFKVPLDAIAIQSKNDELQHPFIHQLKTWAEGTSYYQFGSDFGRSELIPQGPDILAPSSGRTTDKAQPNVVRSYIDAYDRYKEPFDAAIIRDMKKLGYDLAEVACEPLNQHISAPVNSWLLGLVTVERDLGIRNPQLFMSQGMFRALALCIHLNIAVFSGEQRLLLIDDIGEGLDFERATQIIELLTDVASRHRIQVLMTSNDRFVMNSVPLEYWVVLERKGRVVRAFTPQNSPDKFNEFKYVGLSNFDFFKDTRFH